jgi:hypothetical protein
VFVGALWCSLVFSGVRFRERMCVRGRIISLWLCTVISLEGLKKTRETSVDLDYTLTEIRNQQLLSTNHK